MKIIYNDIIPFEGYIAMNLFGVLFVRNEYKDKVDEVTINHESIHTEQIKELLYLPFYILYGADYVLKFLKYWNHKKAYRNISFEREAYEHEADLDYLKTRKHYAQWRKS